MTLHESAHSIKLIDTYTDVSRLISCFNRCHINICCRTFFNDLTWPFICRLYENLINTETIINLLSSTLRVHGIHYNTSYYIYNNQTYLLILLMITITTTKVEKSDNRYSTSTDTTSRS